jgi:hypothetical protein
MPIKNWANWRPEYNSAGFIILCYACEYSGKIRLSEAAYQGGMSIDTACVMLSRLRKAGLIKLTRPNSSGSDRGGLVPSTLGLLYYKQVWKREDEYVANKSNRTN